MPMQLTWRNEIELICLFMEIDWNKMVKIMYPEPIQNLFHMKT